jgi:hypothetical protein
MRATAFVVILTASATLACGPSEQDRVTTQASQSMISVAVAGPANVTPGSTIAYTAIGHTAAGANTDITSRVFWTTGSSGVLTVNGVGQATGKTPGETQIVAALTSTLSGRMTVLVLPAGTFRLTGTIVDGGVPVPGATVSVVSGTGSGSSAMTISDGTYRLYGVAGDVQLQISAPGYTASTQPLSVTANGVADFTLTPASGIPTLTNTYAMTISADSACPTSGAFTLPGDVRERHYTATISQTGPRFQITLGGAVFAMSSGRGNNFSGTILGGQIQFQMNDGYYYGPYPDILESLGGSRYLSIWGSGTLSLAGQDLTGVINGGYGVFNSTNIWGGGEIGACYSRTGHPITLTRQTSTSRIRR